MRKVSHVKKVPVVNANRCTACNRCVEVCESESLEIPGRVAVLVQPNTCCSEGHCVRQCPEDAIQMGWVEMEGNRKRGKWASGGRAWPGRVRGGRYRG